LSPRRGDLSEQIREFAQSQSELLNRTITNGIRLSSFLRRDGAQGWVGYRISKLDLSGEAIPVTLTDAPPTCHLRVLHIFRLDDEGKWLMNVESTFGLYADETWESVIFHYDYKRDPEDSYPTPHINVSGDSPQLQALATRVGKQLSLKDLHLPVGGRRYRPSLEDLVEFLVVHGLAEARPGWQDAIGEHRARFQKRQLGAAVRRDPETALAELRNLGLA